MPIAVMGLFLGGVRAKQAIAVLLLAGMTMPMACLKSKPYQRETAYELYESGCRQSGLRISGHSVANCGRFRGDLGKE